ncbi:MAG: OsmC family peroxiredoxin, partial [Sulfitobacter sp.]|nr:OsmC family peroxiredoxin [Sulfitobacter sp.]
YLEGIRQDVPPKLALIRYRIEVDSDETDARLDLLHRNVLKYGTISNTLSAAVPLEGSLIRKV